MTKLSANVVTKGLSKSKLLVILGVLGAILLSAILFGIFNDSDNTVAADDNKQVYQDNANNTDQLMKKIMENKKEASSVVESVIVVPTVKPQQMVPPIVSQSDNVDDSPEAKAMLQYKKKQLDRKYSSLGSKSLLFSKFPGNKSASAAASNTNKNADGDDQAEDGEREVTANELINESALSGKNGSASQQQKRKFIENSKSVNSDYLSSTIQDAKSLYEVKAGSVIPATMINGLNSDLPGQIIAQVRENVYDSVSRKYLLIPQGAKLVGLYDNNISYGQQRILVAWNRLIYPDGSSINLKAMPGTDLEGYSGFYDEVDNKYWRIFGTSFIMGVITGAMQYSQNNTNATTQVGGLGITTDTNPSVGQTLSGSLGQQLGQTGLSIAQKNLNVQPTLIVKPNYPFNVMLTADMILRPLNKS